MKRRLSLGTFNSGHSGRDRLFLFQPLIPLVGVVWRAATAWLLTEALDEGGGSSWFGLSRQGLMCTLALLTLPVTRGHWTASVLHMPNLFCVEMGARTS